MEATALPPTLPAAVQTASLPRHLLQHVPQYIILLYITILLFFCWQCIVTLLLCSSIELQFPSVSVRILNTSLQYAVTDRARPHGATATMLTGSKDHVC